MKNNGGKNRSQATINDNLCKYLQGIKADHFKRQNKLRYDPQSILNECGSLIQPLIHYIIILKFPLLFSEHRPSAIKQYDKQIKKIYQTFISERKLIIEFQFQFFVFISVKCGKSFIQNQFEEIEITQQDQREMYCIIIKILLGLSIHQKAFTIIQRKFIDQQKFQQCPIIQTVEKSTRQSQSKNDNKSSKKLISLNWIQAKMQRRKQNRFKKNDRSSINTWRNSHEIDEFKENLMKELKVINETDKKIKKIKYEALQRKMSEQNYQGNDLKHLKDNHYFRNNVIHTEQISSSLELNLMMKQCNHSYTRRNIAIRLTDSTPRFSHQLYQISPISPTHRLTSPRESVTIPAKEKGTALSKKTKTYWKKMANKMREINNSFQY